jgi:hypothetical protein
MLFETYDGDLTVFDIKFRKMDDIPFYKKPWFYVTGWLVFLLVVYFWQIYRMGGVKANLTSVFQDFFCVLPFFFLIWMAFFSQFVLPVNNFRDRQKIFDRLFRHLTRSHGPALFIENGVIREHSQETLKRGPGVVWLDSASAAITRTAVAIKKTIGPGVHFTDGNEYIEQAGTLDLHTQSQKLGPKDGEKPFDEKKDGQSAEQFGDIQKRRRQVSALTRDGIELLPDISVTFRVNTGFPQKGEAGSRFGYRTGTTPEAKILEQEDQEVIRRALLGEGINPNVDPESTFHRVAWNRLPAMLAVDVWREYASKFTLDEIFNPTQEVIPTIEKTTEPSYDDFAAMDNPSQARPAPRRSRGIFTRLLRDINNSMESTINSLEQREVSKASNPTAVSTVEPILAAFQVAPLKKTALQVINEMVKARLTQPTVDLMDEYGIRKPGQIESKEFELLQQRGLKVLSVSVSNVRLHPTIQEGLIKQWKANWHRLAKGESELLDFKRNLIETAAQEKAQRIYTLRLSREVDALCRKGKPSVEGLLKGILLRSRAMIRSGEFSNSLRRRMTTEVQDIEDTIKWLGEDET